MLKDPSLLKPRASFADYPGGHDEGYPDTYKQLFRRFYKSIGEPFAEAEYPQFADGLHQLHIVDAAFESNRTRGWVNVPA